MARKVLITYPQDLDEVPFKFDAVGYVTPIAEPVSLTLKLAGIPVGATQNETPDNDGRWMHHYELVKDGEYEVKVYQTDHPNISHTINFNVPKNLSFLLKKPNPGKKSKK